MQRSSSIYLQRGGFYIGEDKESLAKKIQNDPNSIILN